MKKLYLISLIYTGIILLIIIIYAYTINKFSYIPKDSNYENYYDYFIQKIKYEQKQSSLNIDSIQTKLQFDIQKYIKSFDKLSVENGWILDYYYFYNGDAGKPVFFVRRLLDNRDSLLKTFEHNDIYKYCDSNKVIDHLKVNDKDNGYYQLLIFDIIGEDFAKFWHSNYGNIDIICSKRALYKLANRNDDFHRFDSETRKKIKGIDYITSIKDYNDSITYRLLIFNSWNGLSENIFSINKKFPHKIRMISDSILVNYNCGILF